MGGGGLALPKVPRILSPVRCVSSCTRVQVTRFVGGLPTNTKEQMGTDMLDFLLMLPSMHMMAEEGMYIFRQGLLLSTWRQSFLHLCAPPSRLYFSGFPTSMVCLHHAVQVVG